MTEVSNATTAAAPAERITVIEPRPGWHLVPLGELWRYRELLWILALRDIQVRYKQTIVGALWAVLQPLAQMVVLTAFFTLLGRYPQVEGADYPYAVTLYCGLLPWQLFASSLTAASNSLVTNQHLITKVYFPRVIVPVAPVLAGLVDFAIALLILLGLMAWYGVGLSWAALALPGFVLLAMLAAVALGLWLSALNALYRDLRYAVPFMIQLGMFISPVMFETEAVVPERWRALYALNPLVGVLEGFRWALLGKPAPPLWALVASAAMVGGLLLGGLFYFRRMERLFVDRV